MSSHGALCSVEFKVVTLFHDKCQLEIVVHDDHKLYDIHTHINGASIRFTLIPAINTEHHQRHYNHCSRNLLVLHGYFLPSKLKSTCSVMDLFSVVIIENFIDVSVLLGVNEIQHGLPLEDLK